jgi:transposase InsO family protein
MVIDYRRVNSQTRKDAYPVPLIEDCLNACKDADWMSLIDIKDAYHHIEMALESRGITAFVTADGLFEWTRMPFGLATAPATFQRYVDMILRDFIGQFCAIFFDDCLVYTHGTLEQHLDDVERLLKRLHEANLEASPKKCRFAYKELLFVGHIVGKGTIKPDPDKVRAVQDMAAPKTPTELKGFLGLANYYRRFIHGFAMIARPLYELLKKNVKYEWSQNRQLAFAELKRALTTAPCLFAPNHSLPFSLETDASGDGIGGVLSQTVEGETHPVGFVSRQLNTAEKNYITTEWECLAVVWCVGQFEPFLIDKKFTIITDHSALQWLATKRMDNKRLTRWALALQSFSYTIKHRAGKSNANADALSRAPVGPAPPVAKDNDEISALISGTREAHHIRRIVRRLGNSEPFRCCATRYLNKGPILVGRRKKHPTVHHKDDPVVNEATPPSSLNLVEEYELTMVDIGEMSRVIAAQKLDADLGPIFAFLERSELPGRLDSPAKDRFENYARNFSLMEVEAGQKALFYYPAIPKRRSLAYSMTGPRLAIPTEYRQGIMDLFHSSPFGGHSGIKRTLGKITLRYYWRTIYEDISSYISRCPLCQQAKAERHPSDQRTGRMPPPQEPWETISMDYAGPFPDCDGFKHILVIVDHFTNFVVTVPTKTYDAGTTARALFDEVICRFGMPRRILTDRARSFDNALQKDLADLLGIRAHLTSAHHPQANGKAERFVGIVKEALKGAIDSYGNHWLLALQPTTFAINASPSALTTFSPFFLNFGRHPVFPGEHLRPLTYDRTAEASAREAYARELASTLHDAYAYVQTLSAESRATLENTNKELARTPVFAPGDLVWLRDPRADTGMGVPSLVKPYYGPFVVQQRLYQGSTYIIRALRDGQATGVQMTVHAQRLRARIDADTLPAPLTTPALPREEHADTAPANSPQIQISPDTGTAVITPATPTPPAPVLGPAAAAIARSQNSATIPLYSENGLRPSGKPSAERYGTSLEGLKTTCDHDKDPK